MRTYHAYNIEGVKIWRGTLEDEEKFLDVIAIHPSRIAHRSTCSTLAAVSSRTRFFNENL